MNQICPLENLCGPGKNLRQEPLDESEITGLITSARARLHDAENQALALRQHGYRASNRYIVFQVLPHTLGLGPEVWRVLARCHEVRNLGEYEGDLNISDRLVEDLITAANAVSARLRSSN